MTKLDYGPLLDAGRVAARRLQLIEPRSGCVTAEVEDDYHRFFVALRHDGERITGIHSLRNPEKLARLEAVTNPLGGTSLS